MALHRPGWTRCDLQTRGLTKHSFLHIITRKHFLYSFQFLSWIHFPELHDSFLWGQTQVLFSLSRPGSASRPQGCASICSRTEARAVSGPRSSEPDPGPWTGWRCLCRVSQTLLSGLSVFRRVTNPGCPLTVFQSVSRILRSFLTHLCIPRAPTSKPWLVGRLDWSWTENLWTTVHPHPLDSPMSVLIKQPTYSILYSFIYMHVSFILYSEILKLQIHQPHMEEWKDSICTEAGSSIGWAHSHPRTWVFGGSPPGPVFPQLVTSLLHACIHSLKTPNQAKPFAQ